MIKKLRKFLSFLLAATLCLSTLVLPTAALDDNATHVVISQVYGGGGGSGATYKNDFIELYNPTDESISLEGWSVQYTSSGGNSYTSKTALTGDIGPGSYYLIQGSGGSDGEEIPMPDATGNISMSANNGKIALVSDTTTITAWNDSTVVDFVGYGNATECEGSAAAPALDKNSAAIRTPSGVDSDNNGDDFEKGDPNPRNSSYSEDSETKCATPTANPAPGAVEADTEVTFSSDTDGATIQYNTDSADEADWIEDDTVTVTEDTTYYVRAVKDGLEDSEVAEFAYTIDDTATVTIAEAKDAAIDTENIKISGIITYISKRNVYVQDETGAICLYLNANASKLAVGDEIIAAGKRAAYGNLIELSGIDESSVQVISKDNDAPDMGTATVAELIEQPADKTAGYNHMCEIIQVEGAVLTDTSTLTQDSESIAIYPALSDLSIYPGVAAGSTVNATVRMYAYNMTLQVQIISMSLVDGTLAVTASPAAGSVNNNTDVTLICSDSDADIYYTTNGNDPTESSTKYTAPIAVTGEIGQTITIKAFAVKGESESEIVSFEYTIKDPDSALTIKDVLDLTKETKDVTVSGQIAYFATSYSNPVLQSVIDGNIYSLYVYGAAPNGAKVGDTVKLTGTFIIYNGLPELKSVTASEITDSTTSPMDPETVTISYLKTNGSSMLGRFVKIEDVTLGKYVASNSTPVSDSTGSINIYNAAPYPSGVEEGDKVDLYAMVAIYNSTIQLYTGTAEANGFNVYDVVNDIKPPVITLPESFLDAKPGEDYIISVDAADNKGIDSVTISYTIGTTTKSNQVMTKNTENGKYEFKIPSAEIVGTAESIKFTVTAEDVSGLSASSDEKTIAINNGPQITAVTPARNSATGSNKTPEISVTLNNAGDSPVVTMTLKKGDSTLLTNQSMPLKAGETSVYAYTPNQLTDGKYTVSVTVTRSADSISVTDSWSFSVGEAQYTAYFGQLHAHTAEYSDGSGTLKNGLDYIAALSEKENVDFEAFTDHSNYFDTTSAANPAAALNDKSKMTSASRTKWEKYRSDMDAFNATHSGSLLALPGFEMTWSGGPGHINTFNSVGLISRNDSSLNNKTSDAGMKLYYETLIQNTDPLANLSQFNHPGKTFGTFNDFAYWSPSYDSKMVAVEVGNGEGSIGSGGYFPSYEEYTKALDKGWHVAPTNNQDNHKGHWGNSNTARTVIITDSLTTDNLLQGLKDMSVYSTEDKNLNISYTINDQIMGSIISDVPSDPLKFVVNIDDPDSGDVISKAEIITNGGRIAASKSFTSNSADWEFELPSAKGYYYVRVTQADKNIAVTAPVWIGQAAVIGISSLECDTKMPVTDEPMTLTTTLFNNEKSSAALKSISYSQGSTILKTETPGTQIAVAGTLKHTYNFTPSASGATTVKVSAILTLNGEDKEYTANVDLNIRDSGKLVYVGIDASHYNEYVDGNYKDSMGNFANMAANYDVRVVELDTSGELIAAAGNSKYQMLVLTPPTRRNGSAFLLGYKSYSDEEIDAIAAFAEAGGTVIVTSWGDYYEGYSKYSDGTAHTLPADQHMSAQQNKLLSAIGASLRVSDDEIKDDTKNGGQAQRLYLTNYNLENSFLKGVKPSEQVYSNYGGSTIYSVGEDKQPTSVLPSSVSPMVYGFDTSYSSDDDKDNYAGVTIPKYNGKYMVAASETVSHANGKNSTVIVAGSAFMSNFEIQADMDYYGTPEYSNYTILQNVVSSVNPVTITDIADVQAAEEGKTFTIRGIVTSNASGYDKDTAFFDCIYVQDATGGINAFPVAGNIRAGQTVEIKGTTSSYNGERQIAVSNITVINDSIIALPKAISETTAQAAKGANLGSLVSVNGTVTKITTPNNVVESIYVKDSSGKECRVFIDGYITKSKTIPNLAAGAALTATGLSSIDTEGARIRIRDRADIVCKTAQNNPPSDDNSSGDNDNDKDKGKDKKDNSKNDTTKVIGSPETTDDGRTQTSAKITKSLADSSENINVVLKESVINIPDSVLSNLLGEDSNATIQISQSAPSDASQGQIQIAAKDKNITPITAFNFDIVRISGNTNMPLHSLSGSVSVTIALTAEQVAQIQNVSAARLYYYDSESGTFTDMAATFNLKAATVTFNTDHFSTYLIAMSDNLAAGAPAVESLSSITLPNSKGTPAAYVIWAVSLAVIGMLLFRKLERK